MDEGVALAAVAATSKAVAGTRSRKEKVALIAALLAESGSDAPLVAAYLAGLVPQGRLGVGWGRLRGQWPVAIRSMLRVASVDQCFTELARTSGPGSVAHRELLLTGLMASATPDEQQFLKALMLGGLRQGALDAVMVQAVAMAAGLDEEVVRRAVMLSGSVSEVVCPALSGGAEALEAIRLRVGTPVQPMLAASAPDIATALSAGGVRIIERKLDGIRIQAHRDPDGVRLFTRSLDDITDRLPEVVERIAALPCESAVLDGEVIAVRPDGRPEPFQVTGARTASRGTSAAGRAPLTTWLFDVLHLDGTDLIDEPLQHRRECLTKLLTGTDLLVPGLVTDDLATAAEWFTATINAGHEGVVVKDPSGVYAAGRRGSGWIKVKPRHTFDLVVLAVEWGSGRRRGWLSNIHLGARDPATGELVMVGKTFKGMTDEMLTWQTARFQELATDRGEWVVTLRPEQVVEIAIDGVQRSSRYPGGLALRFARVLRYRDDKSVDEIDTIDSLRALGPG